MVLGSEMSFQMDFSDRNWLFIGILCKERSEQLSELKFINFFLSFPSARANSCSWAGLGAGVSAVPSYWRQGTQKKAVPFIPKWCHWQSLPCCLAPAARVSCGSPCTQAEPGTAGAQPRPLAPCSLSSCWSQGRSLFF